METLGVAVAALVVVVVLWMILRRVNEWWYVRKAGGVPAGLKLPPGSMGLPFIGDMPSFVRRYKREPESFLQHHVVSKLEENADDGIYKAHLFGHPCIITCSPEMNKFVLGPHKDLVFGVGWPTGELLGPSSMIMAEGLQHKRMRKMLQDVLTQPAALRKSLLRLEKRMTSNLAQWAQEKNVNLRDKIKLMTFEDICDSFVSLPPGPLVKRMMEYTHGLVAGVRAYPINVPGFSYYHAFKCRRKLMDIMGTIVKNRRQAGPKAIDDDFLDVLLKAEDEEGNMLSDREISDNVVSFLIAGHESTTHAMLWSMVLLAKNPKVLAKLKEEHVALKIDNKRLDIDELKKAYYTDYVLDEVLRFVNIASLIFRSVTRDGVSHKGYYFPKGWKVIAWLRGSHMNPDIFTEPQTFNPDRFLNAPRLGQFLPFGHGPRKCPGNIMALSTIRLLLHILVTNYKWTLVNPDAKVTYLPHPKPVDGAQVVFEPL